MQDALIIGHLVSTTAMGGLIWFVQIVHYPLMRRVGAAEWTGYERDHVRRTTLVVAPLMLAELVTAIGLVVDAPAGRAGLAWVGLALLAAVWALTALVLVPAHRRLERRHEPAMIDRLVAANWPRTIAWSGRVAVAVALAG